MVSQKGRKNILKILSRKILRPWRLRRCSEPQGGIIWHKKRALLPALLAAIILVMSPIAAYAADTPDITMKINGRRATPDVAPFIYNGGYTMVPLRFASTPLDATLLWDNTTKTATLIREDLSVTLVIGNTQATVNGQNVAMTVPAMAKEGRTFVPLRFVAENMGAVVQWLPTQKLITIDFPDAPTEMKISGYYYDYRSLDMLEQHMDTFDEVIHFGYRILADGSIAQKDYFAKDLFESQAYDLLIQNGITPLLLITGFDRTISDTVLASADLRTTLVNNIRDLVLEKGMAGVDLDFEAVSASQKDNFTALVHELKTTLGKNYIVSLSLPPRSNDRQTWLDGYDYAALAAEADQLLVMFYNQHYSGGAPGPVAGADWMETTLEYLLQYIPTEKFHAGLGAYGYVWPENQKGSSVYIEGAIETASTMGVTIQRDETSGVPWFSYVGTDGVPRQLWFEDAQSLAQKAALAKEYGLAGIAIWRMGIVPYNVWLAVVDAIS